MARVETYGSLSFYGIIAARGFDGERPFGELVDAPLNALVLAYGGTGHAFVHFHLYTQTIRETSSEPFEEMQLQDIENYYIGFHPSEPPNYFSACHGHTMDNQRYFDQIDTGAPYAIAMGHCAATRAQWDNAVGVINTWNGTNCYQLLEHDCTGFALDVARQIGLTIPYRSIQYNTLPYQAINALNSMNPSASRVTSPMSVTTIS